MLLAGAVFDSLRSRLLPELIAWTPAHYRAAFASLLQPQAPRLGATRESSQRARRNIHVGLGTLRTVPH